MSIYHVLLRKKEDVKLQSLYIMCCSGKNKISSCGVYISCVAQERRRFKVALSIYHVLLSNEQDLKFGVYISCVAQQRRRFKVGVSIYHVLLRKEENLKLRCLYIMCCSGKKKI